VVVGVSYEENRLLKKIIQIFKNHRLWSVFGDCNLHFTIIEASLMPGFVLCRRRTLHPSDKIQKARKKLIKGLVQKIYINIATFVLGHGVSRCRQLSKVQVQCSMYTSFIINA